MNSLRQHYDKSILELQRTFPKVLNLFVLFVVLNLTFPLSSISQTSNLSTPFVQNYTKKEYSAGSQNRGIQEASNGMLYFNNNGGLLTFDGTEWELFMLPNRTILRTTRINGDKIYVGGQGEIGFFEPSQSGKLTYNSLLGRLDSTQRGFSDVWDIFFINNVVHFRTENKLFRLSEEGTKVLTSPTTIKSSLVVNDSVLVILKDLGIYSIQNDKFVPVYENLRIDKDQLTSMLPWDDYLLIFTQRNGIWRFKDNQIAEWKTGAEQYFNKHWIRTSMVRRNGDLVVGTETGGIVFLDKELRLNHLLTKKNGLQHNLVHSVFEEKSGQIWASLESGIDQILTGESYGKITPNEDLGAKAYAACLHNGKIYLGTNSGLYVKPWQQYYSPDKNQSFDLIPGTEGQVWGMDVIDNRLWLAHANGIYIVAGNQIEKIWDEQGAWKFVKMGKKIVVGTYLGLITLEENNDTWEVKNLMNSFDESSRILVKQSEQDLWVSHPYRGVFKLTFDKSVDKIESIKAYKKEEGITNPLNNYIFSVHDHTLIGTEQGILKYNRNEDNFTPFDQYNDYLGKESWIQRLVEDDRGNIWYVKNNQIGMLEIEDKGLEKSISNHEFNILQEDLVGGFELIYPANEQNVFIGIETGFIHLNTENISEPDSSLQLGIYAALFNDSLYSSNKYYSEQTIRRDEYTMTSDIDNALFKFGVTDLTAGSSFLYRNKLIGVEDEWSEWSAKREKEYANIKHGDYEFQVQAKSEAGHLSSVEKFSFAIQAPWYASLVAKFLYALICLGLIAGLVLIPRSRFQKEKAQMESAYNEEMEKTQEELVMLKNEKLESELKFKNKELASATMHWAQKGEILKGIKSHLDKIISEKPESEKVFKSLRSLVRSIERDAQLDDSWDQFAKHFDEVHANFLKRIKETHPAISTNDLKLCAYLKMNLNTKEIAPLLNISVRGVEASRYRLRKKMSLAKEVNLVEYIMTF